MLSGPAKRATLVFSRQYDVRGSEFPQHVVGILEMVEDAEQKDESVTRRGSVN